MRHLEPSVLRWKIVAALALTLVLAACSVLEKPTRAVLYDFGPGAREATTVQQAVRPALRVAEVEAASALDSTVMWYRLAYADAQQVLPYAQARWSMPPAQLLRQRLRSGLEQQFVAQSAGGGAGALAGEPRELQIRLQEFSQLFDSPERSVGLLRLHATVVGPTSHGGRLIGERSFVVERPASSADAAGGARALSAAADAVQEEIRQWLTTLR